MTSNMAAMILIPIVLLIGTAAGLEKEDIIGGTEIKTNQMPYQVSIQTSSHTCGGSLVAADVVLTAAHCVVQDGRVPPLPYQVLGGSVDLSTNKGRKIAVSKIYVHKKYTISNDGTALNDIALMRLARRFEVQSDSSVGIVNLPLEGENFSGKVAEVSGFGWDKVILGRDYKGEPKEHGTTDKKLRYTFVNIIQPHRCKARIYPTIICGQAVQTSNRLHNGVCSGDSGGPLVYNKKIIGIVSSSPLGCDESLSPAYYTKVTSYLDFIKGAIDDKPTADTLTVAVDTRYTFVKN